MITFNELINKENINIQIPKALRDFELSINPNTYKYSTEHHDGDKVHVFEGKILDTSDELSIFYNERKKELCFIGNGHYNVYDKDGKHIAMS